MRGKYRCQDFRANKNKLFYRSDYKSCDNILIGAEIELTTRWPIFIVCKQQKQLQAKYRKLQSKNTSRK